jgi:septal ring factor EnvC (AmiA/AmiB activator)
VLRLFAFSLLIAGSTVLAASAPAGPERPPIDLALQQARSDAAQATAEQHRLEAQAASARDDVTRLRAQQLAAAQAIAAAEAEITAADVAARLAQARLSAQRERLAAAQAPASALLGGLALTARRPPLLLLAGDRSAEELVKLRLLIAATAPAIRARTAALASELERGDRLQKVAIAARDASIGSRDELARRRSAFAGLEQRAVQLAQSRGSQALSAGDVALARNEQLSQVELQTQSRQSAMDEARSLAALGPAPLPAGAQAPGAGLDYMLPADAAVTDGLGSVSASGVRSRGITLATRRGAQLAAPADGTILFSGPFRDYDGVIIIDHGGGWKSVLVNAGTKAPRGTRVRMGDPLGIALGPVEVQLQHGANSISPALIAGSSEKVSNMRKGG